MLVLFITRHSLVRAKGERYLCYCMFLFAFLSTISRQPAGRFTPNFACGRTLVPDVSSPLLGVSGPPGGEGEMSNANGWFVSVLLTHLFAVFFTADCF